MAKKTFFAERLDQSEVKARIIEKYFWAWAKVIMPSAKLHDGRIAYIDLYAGPGRYKDGAASTPLLILEKAIADPDMSQMLVALFNDQNAKHTESLQAEIQKLPGISGLKYEPKILTGKVDADAARLFEDMRLIPSFTFFDPFGYKGLSLNIIKAVLKDWGCDCVFFFNYARINAGIDNPSVASHLEALFGRERFARLGSLVKSKTPAQREAIVLRELAQEIKEMGPKFVLQFRFKNASGKRTSHCLVFASKHVLGYNIMKGIMAAESSTEDQGVASFCYSPADAARPVLFSLSQPLDALEGDLLKKFSGRSLMMAQVFEEHQVDTPYLPKNYKDALRNLEAAGKIKCEPPAANRLMRNGQRTFADRVLVTFPRERR